MYSSPLT